MSLRDSRRAKSGMIRGRRPLAKRRAQQARDRMRFGWALRVAALIERGWPQELAPGWSANPRKSV